ncbi:septal ring lytic transglycosylase RlpA family lipoprotein, partial [Pseudomonas aeruginosa]
MPAKTYYPLDDARAYRMVGTAAWSGTKLHGKATASAAACELSAVTSAHKARPLPCYVRVTSLECR